MINNLVRRDILELEQRLRDSLHQVLGFESHAVFFPQDSEQEAPLWLPEEGRLLLPLVYEGQALGVFMARNPDPDRVEALLPTLPRIAALCLDNLALYKRSRRDPHTGLATREVLFEELSQEIEQIRAAFGGALPEGQDAHPYSGCLGLMIVRFKGLRDVVRDTSYSFVDQLTLLLVQALRDTLPEQALVARTGDCECGILLPEATRQHCEAVAEQLLAAMDQVRLQYPLTGRQHGVQTYVGYALYPQDMDGVRQRHEQARILFHEAGLAAEEARARAGELGGHARRIMGYGGLLHEGGRIRQVLPLSRVLTTLGRSVGAREGQRFSVWSIHYTVQGTAPSDPLQPLYKGEIVLLEVRESESVAEILHLGDPAWPLEPEDNLTLLPEERGLSIQESLAVTHADTAAQRLDPLTGLYRHGDFLARLAKGCADCTRYALALVHLDLRRTDASSQGTPFTGHVHEGQLPPPDHLMALVADQCRAAFGVNTETPVLGGRFGLNSLIFFHPEEDAALLKDLYTNVCTHVTASLGLRCGAGIACWPFLDFRPSDMLECTRKALEYALLLPAPHVGVFDSLAMNISADKRSCRGDVFGAIEEYKLALLADVDNALAWNSLGVCMASLGHHTEARRHIEEAWRRTPDDPAVAYNLGAVCQSLRDTAAASEAFSACIRLDPSHLYAVVRLGQLAEDSGDMEEARRRFEDAAAAHANSALPHRHLAQLALRLDRVDRAREHIHQALLRNPRDAEALAFMAQLYLDGGEDPELAEMLARQSVAQRPDRKKSWIVLARALEVQGRRAEAREVLLKAGEV